MMNSVNSESVKCSEIPRNSVPQPVVFLLSTTISYKSVGPL